MNDGMSLEDRLAAQIGLDTSEFEIAEDARERIGRLVTAAENTDVNLAVDKSDGTLYWNSPSGVIDASEDGDGFIIRLTADDTEPTDDSEPNGKYVRTPEGWE